MSEGRIPVSEALHYAMSLADSLRKLHDAGKAHGAVTPSSIEVTATGLDLIPSLGPSATVTPYTAPEVVQGQPADARSDIFSFGALVFEMLTGHRAFDGESQTELKLALCNSAPSPSGSPAVDRLVASCVAKSPAARWQRMQKIIMELKLLTVAARRADAAPAARGVSDTAMRSEMQQLEGRLSARLAAYEKNIAAMQRTAGDAVESLREQLAGVHTQLTAVESRPVSAPVDIDALTEKIDARVQQAVEAVTQQMAAVTEQMHKQVAETLAAANGQHSAQVQEAFGSVTQQLATQVKATVDAANEQHAAKLQETLAAAAQQHAAQAQESIAAAATEHVAQANETVAAVNRRMEAAEQNMEDIRKHFATLQENVAGDLHDFEKTLKTQGAAIESARTAMAQTDDLVERVVEALELLQSSLLDQHETAGVN
jgi:hypothetical protein